MFYDGFFSGYKDQPYRVDGGSPAYPIHQPVNFYVQLPVYPRSPLSVQV